MPLDPERYPRAAAYLARLPHGLSSYPDCLVRADVYDEMRILPRLRAAKGLPRPIGDYLAGNAGGDWIPDVLGCALVLLARDVVFDSDQELLDWTEGLNTRLFRRPLYRALIYLITPRLLVLGAARRWPEFHRGSVLTVTTPDGGDGRLRLRATLSFPPHLFCELQVASFGTAYRAALAAARAEDVSVELQRVTDTCGELDVSWSA